jgi:hypothetical protein
MTSAALLDSAAVAVRLGCTRRHAAALMAEMGAVDISRYGSRRPTWRISEEGFAQWQTERSEGAAQRMVSGSAARSGGRASRARDSARAVKTGKRRRLREQDSSEKQPIRLARSHGALP